MKYMQYSFIFIIGCCLQVNLMAMEHRESLNLIKDELQSCGKGITKVTGGVAALAWPAYQVMAYYALSGSGLFNYVVDESGPMEITAHTAFSASLAGLGVHLIRSGIKDLSPRGNSKPLY